MIRLLIPPLDLTNTPGIYYAVSSGLAVILFIMLNKKRGTAAWRIPRLAAVWILLFLFMLFTYRIRVELFLLCVVIEAGMLVCMMRIGTDMSWNNTLYFGARAFIMGEFMASLEWQLFYYALTKLGVPLRMWINILFQIVIFGAAFLIFWLMERRFAEGNLTLVISRRELITVIVLVAITYALSNISYVLKNSPFSSAFTHEIFSIRTLADLGGVAILFSYHMVLHELNTMKEVSELQRVLDQQMEQFHLSEETVDLINRKYHDLKHQIAYLKSDITEEEKRAYLDEMEKEVRIYEAQNRTGNHVVDTILTEKSLLCRKKDIQLTAVVDGTAVDFLPVPEICSLLGNALDNALEAAGEVQRKEERLIRFSVSRQRDFLQIQVENRFEGTRRMKDGLPQTTKSDSKQHGFGVLSMKKIVEKYDGSLRVSTKDGWFLLHILMPVPEEKKAVWAEQAEDAV